MMMVLKHSHAIPMQTLPRTIQNKLYVIPIPIYFLSIYCFLKDTAVEYLTTLTCNLFFHSYKIA